eukprot:g424.t1
MFTQALLVGGAPFRKAVIFEPVPLLFNCMCDRFRAQFALQDRRARISLRNFALADTDYATSLLRMSHLDTSDHPPGWNTLIGEDPSGSDLEAMEAIRIHTRTGSSVLREMHIGGKEISVVKIDVEGFEGHVLRGMLDWMREEKRRGNLSPPVFLIEVGWGQQHPHLKENQRTYEILANEFDYCPLSTSTSSNMTRDVVLIPRIISPSCSFDQEQCCVSSNAIFDRESASMKLESYSIWQREYLIVQESPADKRLESVATELQVRGHSVSFVSTRQQFLSLAEHATAAILPPGAQADDLNRLCDAVRATCLMINNVSDLQEDSLDDIMGQILRVKRDQN